MAAQKLKSFLEKELVLAVWKRDSNYVERLVHFCDGTFRDNKGNTLLHYYSTVEITKMLIEKTNVEVNSKNKYGDTPLSMWCLHVSNENGKITSNYINKKEFKRNYNIMKCLLQSGANCNIQDDKGCTVLKQVLVMCLAPEVNLLEDQVILLVQLLLSHNADPNIKSCYGMTPLHSAIHLKSTSLVRLLINHDSNINAQNNDGHTPLHLLALDKYDDDEHEIARLLLENGADPTAQNKDGMTALHLAAGLNHVDVAKVLIENSANVDSTTNWGSTALHSAARSNSVDVAMLLIENSANLDATVVSGLFRGLTPLQVAEKWSRQEMVDLLKNA